MCIHTCMHACMHAHTRSPSIRRISCGFERRSVGFSGSEERRSVDLGAQFLTETVILKGCVGERVIFKGFMGFLQVPFQVLPKVLPENFSFFLKSWKKKENSVLAQEILGSLSVPIQKPKKEPKLRKGKTPKSWISCFMSCFGFLGLFEEIDFALMSCLHFACSVRL